MIRKDPVSSRRSVRDAITSGGFLYSHVLGRAIVRAMADLDADIGSELQFADGKFVVDKAYVSAIHEATDGDPSRFTYREALAKMSPVLGKDLLRRAQNDVIRQHFGVNRPWGS